jgi:hypothetical protein
MGASATEPMQMQLVKEMNDIAGEFYWGHQSLTTASTKMAVMQQH